MNGSCYYCNCFKLVPSTPVVTVARCLNERRDNQTATATLRENAATNTIAQQTFLWRAQTSAGLSSEAESQRSETVPIIMMTALWQPKFERERHVQTSIDPCCLFRVNANLSHWLSACCEISCNKDGLLETQRQAPVEICCNNSLTVSNFASATQGMSNTHEGSINTSPTLPDIVLPVVHVGR